MAIAKQMYTGSENSNVKFYAKIYTPLIGYSLTYAVKQLTVMCPRFAAVVPNYATMLLVNFPVIAICVAVNMNVEEILKILG